MKIQCLQSYRQCLLHSHCDWWICIPFPTAVPYKTHTLPQTQLFQTNTHKSFTLSAQIVFSKPQIIWVILLAYIPLVWRSGKKTKHQNPKILLLTSCHWTEVPCTLRAALLTSHLLFLFHFPGNKGPSSLLMPSLCAVTDSLTYTALQFYNLSAFILIYVSQSTMLICSSGPVC